MWTGFWGAASCGALLALACGKSEHGDPGASRAGTTTHAEAGSESGEAGTAGVGAGSGGATGSGGGGTAGGNGGSTVGGNGGNTVGGGGANTGGVNVPSGGQSTDPAEAGAPGAGGDAASCAPGNFYPACGCGCCGLAHAASCVYPDLGQDLTDIAEQDEARAAGGGCAQAGCSLGMDYFCCAAPPASDDGASYETSWYIGGVNRLRLHKQSSDCTTLELQQTSPTEPPAPGAFPLTLPAGFKLDGVRASCTSGAVSPAAIGAIGTLAFRVSNNACVLDAHFTAFFTDDARRLTSVRFDADGVPVARPLPDCQ